MPRKKQKRPTYWTDHGGKRWKVPDIKDRLRPHQIAGHAALKAFVICRDGGKCRRCGSLDSLVADHVISRRNGGTHHPDNLQALCKTCNDAKSNFEDRGRTRVACGRLSPAVGGVGSSTHCCLDINHRGPCQDLDGPWRAHAVSSAAP